MHEEEVQQLTDLMLRYGIEEGEHVTLGIENVELSSAGFVDVVADCLQHGFASA